MSKIELVNNEFLKDDMSFSHMVKKFLNWVQFIRTRIFSVICVGILFAILGFVSIYSKKANYTATLTFALEEEKATAMSGALGLASSLGLDIGGGNAGGIFASSNIMELMRSRFIVKKALSRTIDFGGKAITLGNFYLLFTELSSMSKSEKLNVVFQNNNRESDSIFNILYTNIIDKGILSVFQKDKKVSIITIQVISENEVFSKEFAESVSKEVSAFYVDTKSKKARLNYEILQRQTDSIRNELNTAISGVAQGTDNTYNLNPALNIKRVFTTRRQIDVQANTAILTQLVANLELAKVSLRKETPLIQIVDKPTYPLLKKKPSLLIGSITGFILGVIVMLFLLTAKRSLSNFLVIKQSILN